MSSLVARTSLVAMPPTPRPAAIPAGEWEALVKSELQLLDMEADLRGMERSFRAARKTFRQCEKRVKTDRNRIMSLILQGAGIEGMVYPETPSKGGH